MQGCGGLDNNSKTQKRLARV